MPISPSGRLTRPLRRLTGALLLVAGSMAPVAAGEFFPAGDGSDTNNADLLGDPAISCASCASAVPAEWDAPPFDLDWSLALRGAYVNTAAGSYLQGVAAPSVTLTREFLRGGFEVTADAEISRSTIENFRIGAVRLGASGTYQLDEATGLAGNLDLAITRDSVASLGSSPTILRKPLTLSGSADGSITHAFGAFVVTGSLNASRTMYEPTLLVGPVVQDNGHQNNWVAGGGLRLGYRVTPILTAFIDGSAAYQTYDAPSPTYLVKLDAYDLEGRVGLSGAWGSVWEAEASVGYGMRRFVDPSLGQAGALLTDASVTFRPNETLELVGALTTTFDAPGADTLGYARLRQAVSGDLRYRVNPWLSLRASADAYNSQLIGTASTERGVGAGLGADYLLNEHTTLSADYAYAWREANPNPAEDEHRVTLGVTFSR